MGVLALYAILFLSLLALFLFLLYKCVFLRNPKRKIPAGNNIVSPADGKIVRILDVNDKPLKLKKGLMGKINALVRDVSKSAYVIVIVMNLHNVHYQRSPAEGEVEKIKYSKGKFQNAVANASSLRALENEKNEILIKNEKIGKIKVIQIAGILARRIVCFAKEKQKLNKGRLIGLIKLGSQVVLILPKNKINLKAKENQKVRAGETIIAEIK